MARQIIGFSGRINSGKTFASNFITKNIGYKVWETNKLSTFIANKLDIPESDVLKLFEPLKDTLLREKRCLDVKYIDDKFIQVSLATPLKLIISNIFDIDYDIINGHGDKQCRENISVYYDNQKRSCREIMELFGTNILRNYDPDIFVKASRKIINSIGANIVIDDIRFENELCLCTKNYIIYNDEIDLVITDDDKNTHIAKWGFLQFQDKMIKLQNKKDITFINNLKLILNI